MRTITINNRNPRHIIKKIEKDIIEQVKTSIPCSNQPNDDYIDFENGNSVFIFDIENYINEYEHTTVDMTLEEYISKEIAMYIDNKRELPN